MKNFIKTIFAVIFGNLLFFGFFFIVIVGLLIGAAMNSNKEQVTISKNSVLNLNLRGSLSDMSQNKDIFFGNGENSDLPTSIYEVVQAIKKAKNDDKIKALWISMNMNQEVSYAQIDVLRAAIQDFKSSDKPVIAYGELASQKMYYLATAADHVYINPNGGLDVRGFGAQVSFFKNTLDKLEIQPQIFYAGKFKSATEPLRLNKMSEENKTQTRELLTDVANHVLRAIAKDRHLDPQTINTTIDQMQSNTPREAAAAKLIDGEKYFDEVESELARHLHQDAKERFEHVSIYKYIGQEKEDIATTKKIAVYVAEGDIVDGKSDEASIGSITMVEDLRKMADNNEIKAVVLRINSPGGSALASGTILREIDLLKKKKPVIISMGNLAASGGYYIACSGNKIFAEPNTITGSIGVFGIIPNIGKMLENKFGVSFDEVELNEHAVVGVTKNLDAMEAAKIQAEIENTYLTFKKVVSQGRKMHIDSVETIAQGRVWSGERAKSLHLVDEIGGLKDAIAYTASLIKSTKSDYYFFNKRKSQIEQFMEDFTGSAMIQAIQEKIVRSFLKEHAKHIDILKQYEGMKGVQMKMPYQVVIL